MPKHFSFIVFVVLCLSFHNHDSWTFFFYNFSNIDCRIKVFYFLVNGKIDFSHTLIDNKFLP